MYIDCHAHIFFSPIPVGAIDEDIIGEIPIPTRAFIDKMISNAKEKGVSHIVGVISNPNEFSHYKDQLGLENIIHVIGISRNHALENQSLLISLLEKEIKREIPHGLGEIGLDYAFSSDKVKVPEQNIIKKKQQELFSKQIQLAKEINVPIVIHAGYGTDKDIVKILKKERAQDVGCQIHGYMSNEKLVSELLDMGFYFSFGYLHTREEEFRNIIEITPIEQILTETDSPYHLFDSPKRFIFPEDIVLIADEIARLKETTPKMLTNQIIMNTKELFHF